MSQPTIKTAMQIVKLDRTIKELQEKKNKLKSQLFKKYNESSFCYELEEPIDGKSFLRIKLTDNIKKLDEGVTIFKSAGFTGQEMEISFLKNKPKEM